MDLDLDGKVAVVHRSRQGHRTRDHRALADDPAEVATRVVLLASERTGNVTGADYVIDGRLVKTA
jgi:NAD(P)-dependent dehydrogenase (short-subunit alcohol dehydrogenase family)